MGQWSTVLAETWTTDGLFDPLLTYPVIYRFIT